MAGCVSRYIHSDKLFNAKFSFYIYTGWNDKIVVLKKTTLQLYFKTFIEKINSSDLIIL